METTTLITLIIWGIVILNLFGISKEIKDEVFYGTGKVWGGVFIGIGLGAWAIWRANIVFLFADRLDTAIFGAAILTLVWAFVSWLYYRDQNA